ncbi:MAG TPA: sigma-70 family RNA polymerase sigma factor [Actinomycetota bacterium]
MGGEVMPLGEARALGETVSAEAPYLAALYEEHVGRATALATLLTGDASVAEDIAHDAFLRAAGRFRHLREPDAFGAYLRRTVVNACRARARRARRERLFLERAWWVRKVEPDTSADDRDELLPLIKALPYRQRAALVLRYWDDLPEAQIADILRTSPRAVNALLSRAMGTLRSGIGRSDR